MDREIERKEKAKELIRYALAILESDLTALDELPRRDTHGSAFWKLVDAAGLLSPICFVDAVGQQGNPTGRGFSLSVGEASLRHMHDPKEL